MLCAQPRTQNFFTTDYALTRRQSCFNESLLLLLFVTFLNVYTVSIGCFGYIDTLVHWLVRPLEHVRNSRIKLPPIKVNLSLIQIFLLPQSAVRLTISQVLFGLQSSLYLVFKLRVFHKVRANSKLLGQPHRLSLSWGRINSFIIISNTFLTIAHFSQIWDPSRFLSMPWPCYRVLSTGSFAELNSFSSYLSR
jgi:hypothetical protein